LQKIVKDKLKKEHEEDLNKQDYTKTDAEEDKKSLSKRENINVRINKKNIKVTRAEFEQEISTLIAQTEMICESILNENNLTTSDIQDVFLAGGSTRVPSVEDTIKRVFGKTPVKSINVDEVVVLGASLYATYKGDPSKPTPPPDPTPAPVQHASVIDSADDYSIIDKFLVD
jgi:molecular chaperone DnaK